MSKPDLTPTQERSLKDYVAKTLGNDASGHGRDHIDRVVRTTRYLAHEEGVAPLIPLVAAYLHDTIDEKLFANVAAAKSRTWSFLGQLGLTNNQAAAVMNIIENMSYSATLDGERPKLSPAGQIVQDADWLDAIGAIGIVRAVYYGGKHAQTIYDPQQPPRENMTKATYRDLAHETIINHFDEKLLKLAGMLNTKTARELAAPRQALMKQFLAAFLAEWRGEDELN